MPIAAKQRIGLFAGPAVALILLLFLDMQPGAPVVTRTAAVVVLMAIWWVTEAIPIPATALIPVALFPLLGIMSGKAVAGLYFNHIIFLFIGGFMMALAMQRWGLHRRIALRIILLIGVSPRRIVLGFMLATFFLSMWISNTASTMMIVPMAMAIILKLKQQYPEMRGGRFSAGLLIGIAYAASIGGTATLIGTPPNLAFARIFQIYFPDGPDITFATWFGFAVPLAMVFLILAWIILIWLSVPRRGGGRSQGELYREEYAKLGPMSFEELMVLILFTLMALAWLLRRNIELGALTIPGWSNLAFVPGFIDDGTVAVGIAILLFLIPSRANRGERLMNWKTAAQLHWGIVLLFGGGFAIASGFRESGLSLWIGEQLAGLEQLPPIAIVAAACASLTFLTELTSNTATTEILLPILGSLAVAIKANPLLLMVPATLSASCAFMLPVATPPNAIVFGTGEVSIGDMIRVGIYLNLIGVVLITTYMFFIGVVAFGINSSQMPPWAAP